MNSKQAETQKIAQPKEGKSSGGNSGIDPFRKIVGQVCCSRHLYCIQNQEHACSQQNNSFSINSELLGEFTPINLSAQPLIEYQIKPEVDMLAQINIRKKEYEVILKKCEEDIEKEEKQKRLQQINAQAKKALEKSKKVALSPKRQWGHSLFIEEKKNVQKNQVKKETSKEKKKIEMKPITQRIAEYKHQQMIKEQQQAAKYQREHREVNIKEAEGKIQSNAAKLLEEMRLEKIKKEEERKVIEAKIRALQIKSIQKVKNCKKKQFVGGQQFNLGDSQYSTFSARANNRKLQKKKKKQKPKVPTKEEQINASKRTSNFLKKSSQNSKRSTQKLKTQQIIPTQNQKPQQNPQEQVKGPFFIWNIPVYQGQLQKLQKSNDKIFMNIERLNQKSGKTFRQQANQFLTKKMEQKMKEQRQLAKTQNFMMEIQAKKQDLLKTFDRQQSFKVMSEPFWNQDEVFKPNSLQNFHFYTRASPQ